MADFFGLNSKPKRVEIRPPPPTPSVTVGANPNTLMQLADMLKATQAKRALENPSPANYGAMANPQAMGAAQPQPSPPIQPADYAQLAGPQAMGAAPMPSAAPPPSPPPAAPIIAPANQQPPVPAVPPPEPYGPAEPYGQGMMKMPQTAAELEAWRKMMDQMQFARQGV